MLNRNFCDVLLLALATLASTAAMAANDDIVVELEVFTVHPAAEGRSETLTPAGNAKPGDVLEYRATYRNQGRTTARKLEATLPVPVNSVAYLPGSARPQQVWASLDGNRYDAVPLRRTVKLADGSQQSQLIPPAEYRFLRWTLGDLSAGASTTVVSRMKVAPLQTPVVADKGSKP